MLLDAPSGGTAQPAMDPGPSHANPRSLPSMPSETETAPSRAATRLPAAAAALAGIAAALVATQARAYEGAGILRDAAPDAGPASQLTKAPELKKFSEATYPPDALDAGVGGEVALLVDIDAEGRVMAAEVTRSGGEEFDRAAREAVLRFEFSPAEVDGKPAAVRIEYVYHFEARTPPPPPEPPPAEKPVNLTGHALTRGTREPISGASVFLPGSDLHAETDGKGSFEIRGAPSGTSRIEIFESHHERYSAAVEIKPGEATDLTAYLLKTIGGPFESVVRSERDKTEVTQRTLQKDELTTVPGTFGDPLRVLTSMPGMARPPYSMGTLLVRGSQPQDTTVLFDGVPVPLLYHFSGGPSVVSPSFIDKIDFFPGAYGAQYGRAIAGVVDVATKSPEPSAVHGTLKLDLLDAGFYVEGPLGENRKYGSFALAARRSLVDAVLPFLLKRLQKSGGSTFTASPDYWDYQARYTLDVGKNRLELSAFGSNDALSVAQSGDAETQPFSLAMSQGFHRAQLRWTRAPEDGWSFAVAPSFGTTSNTFSVNDQMSGSTSSWDLALRAHARKELSPRLSFEAGLDLLASFYDVRYQVAQQPGAGETAAPPPVVSDQKVQDSSYAVYLQSVWSPVERWKLIPGLRVETYVLPSRTTPVLEPRLATRVLMTDWLTAKAGWGFYHEAPLAQQMSANFGNPDLGLSQSQQIAAGVEVKPLRSRLPGLLLDVQGFYNARTGLVVTSQNTVERGGKAVPERYDNSGHGRAYGLEVLLKHDLTERFYGWVAYTLSRSEQYDETTGTYVPTLYDQTHILTVVASYKLSSSWQVGARFQLTTGQPQTPVLGASFNADTGRYQPVDGVPGSTRGPAFNQLDLRVEKLWTYSTWQLSTYLDVQNVFNASNPQLTLWDYRYQESAPLRGLPLLPTLGVSGKF